MARKTCRLYGHVYDTDWMREFLKQHTARQVQDLLPDVIDVKQVRALAYRIGAKCEKGYKQNSGRKTTDSTLCWSCQKATDGNACPWVQSFTEVKGWTAKRSFVRYTNGYIESYKVTKCPLYVGDKK